MKALGSIKILSNEVKNFFSVLKESQRLHSSVTKTFNSKFHTRQPCPASFNSLSSSHLKLSSVTAWWRSYSSCWFYKTSTPVNWKSAEMIRLPLCSQQIRRKSKKRQDSRQNSSESDSDDDDALAPDDFDAPAKFKVIKIHTPSMRTDAIISNSLDVSRSRLEEMFYGPGLLFNGAKMLKKSIKMEEGDYVDLVVDKAEEQLKVKRVKIIKIYLEKTNTEKLNVKVRVWKTPFLVNNPKNDRRSS